MSEEEIIKYIKTVRPKNFNNYADETNYTLITKKQVKAIEGLLDLYNKEKEKREIAEENHKVLSLDIAQACKDLGLPEDTIIADELVLEIKKKFISKDKIKEKIEELSKTLSDTNVITISVLQELLEE